MTGAALALVAALAVSVLAQGAPAPLPPRPPAPSPDVQIPVTPQPRAVCRMPVVRGDNRVDPRFVAAREPGLEVRFSMRRLPGEKLECPDPAHPKR